MEATREIYWNVGHGVVWPMYLLSFAAAGLCGYGFYRRLQVYRLGRPVNRLDHVPQRLAAMVRGFLGQRKVLRARGPGTAHALFFWAFLVLFAGTLLVMVQADLVGPLLRRNLLRGDFYRLYSLALDVAGLLAVVMLVGLALRRLLRGQGLATVRSDWLVLGLTLAILLTGFLVEGIRMAATELRTDPELARFSPVGLAVAKLVAFGGGGRAPALLAAHQGLWWLHFLLVAGFIASIPFTKLRHLFTAPAGYLLADRRPRGSIATLDLEAEGTEQFGAARITDLTWKDVFDADACTGCQRCQDRCPAHATAKPLSPMKLVKQLGEAALRSPEASLADTVGRDALWSCTTCFACQDVCPASVEHVNKVVEMRRHLSLMEGEFPGDEVRTAASNVEVNGNPFGFDHTSRGDWATGLEIPVLGDGAEVDVLYFAGCYASFDRRNREVARSFMRICRTAGVRVGILGKEERCCGDAVRKLGNEYLYQATARQNVETIRAYGVKKVVTTCPHCFGALSRDYRDLGLELEVEHHTAFIDRLIANGKLPIAPDAFDCTYHDSCYLGRYQGVFEAPRSVLRAAGGRLVEMERSGRDGFCCGAGGGRILAEEKLGSRISVARVEMARATGAPVVVSNCPFCLAMLEDGVKTGGCDGSLNVKDLAELVAERMGG